MRSAAALAIAGLLATTVAVPETSAQSDESGREVVRVDDVPVDEAPVGVPDGPGDLTALDDPRLEEPPVYVAPENLTPGFPERDPFVSDTLQGWEPPRVATVEAERFDVAVSEIEVRGSEPVVAQDLRSVGRDVVRLGWDQRGVEKAEDGASGDARVEGADIDVESPPGSLFDPLLSVEVFDENFLDRTSLSKAAMWIKPNAAASAAARSGATLTVGIDYDSFRYAYGGDWAGRLRLVSFEWCWVNSPRIDSDADCPEPVVLEGAVNDIENGIISVELPAAFFDPASADGAGPQGFMQAAGGGGGIGLDPDGSSDLGDYSATDLSDSAEWDVGLNGGSFSWSYSLPMVAPPAGPTPDVSMLYSSGSIDGLIGDENTQGGLLGVGWTTGTDAFIEREFRACALDEGYTSNDLCFFSPNGVEVFAPDDEARYRLSMSGNAGLLLWASSSTISWNGATWQKSLYRLEHDTGLEITRWRNLSATGIGGVGVDNDGEFFTAQDPAGNQYWFGYGRPTGVLGQPNPADGTNNGTLQPDQYLNSQLTVPAIGNSADEPCFGGASYCHQGYRWMLDRVIDATDLAMVMVYNQDWNQYAGSLPAVDSFYVSGALLERVFYGATEADVGTPGKHTGMIDFNYGFRCTTSNNTCAAPGTGSNPAEYPDVPLDKFCAPGDCPSPGNAPIFFHRNFLLDVTSNVRVGPAAEDWEPHAQVKPTHAYFQALKNEIPRPFIYKMQRFGYAGSATPITLPEIEFQSLATFEPDNDPATVDTTFCGPWDPTDDAGFRLADCGVRLNRVNHELNGATGVRPMGFMRINRVRDEAGGETRIYYSESDDLCLNTNGGQGGNGQGFWTDNNNRCFPGTFLGVPIGFNKFVVTEVLDVDRTGSSPDRRTVYDYLDASEDSVNGGVGWVKSTDKTFNSFNEYRGYYQVIVTSGDVTGQQKITRHRFMRGMNGHTNAVPIVVASGETIFDVEQHAGNQFDMAVLRATGTEFSRESTKYGLLISPMPTDPFGKASRQSVPVEVFTSYDIATPDVEYSKTVYEYDLVTFNRIKTLEFGETTSGFANIGGPTQAVAADSFVDKPDDRCTLSVYTSPTSVFIDGLLQQVVTYDNVACAATPLTDTEFGYDLLPVGSSSAARGQLTLERTVTGTNPGIVGNPASLELEYRYETSQWRRVNKQIDARNNETSMAYADFTATQLGNLNVRTVTTTNAEGHTAVVEFDNHGRTSATTDLNSRVTHQCWDKLNRLIDIYFTDNTAFAGCDANDQPTPPESYSSIHYQYAVDIGPPEGPFIVVGLPSWTVTTSTLWSAPSDSYNDGAIFGNYLDEIAVLDGYGNNIEIATQSPNQNAYPNGWIVARTLHDDVGRTTNVSEGQATPTQPTFGRTLTNNNDIDRDHRTNYDDVSRPVGSDLLNGDGNNVTVHRSTGTSYAGYSVTSSPPVNNGDTATYGNTTTTNDIYGNVIQVVREVGSTQPAPTHTTRHSYNMRFDRVETATPDTSGSPAIVTEFEHNNLGWARTVNEPNAGVHTTVFYPTGEVRQTTDAKNADTVYDIDDIGRILTSTVGTDPAITANRLTEFVYDTAGEIGALDTEVAYQPAGTEAWRREATSFDLRGRLTGWDVTVDAADGPGTSDDALANTYSFTETYTRAGTPLLTDTPTMGGLAAETLATQYSSLGYRTKATSPQALYISASGYDPLGRPQYVNTGSNPVWMNTIFAYRDSDGRMTAREMDARGSGVGANNKHRFASEFYSYDAPGNIDVIYRNVDTNSLDERECFYYDGRQRLSSGFTKGRNNNGNGGIGYCPETEQSNPNETGPAAYDYDYAYDGADRFTINANRTGNIYNAPSPATNCSIGTIGMKPHALKSINAAGSSPSQQFEYDCNGAMVKRIDSGTDTWQYTYDTEQRLTAVTDPNNNTSTNIYDSNGQRVVRIDPNGDRTVYYGTTELHYDATAQTVSATRLYPGGGIRTATGNTNSTLTWTATGYQGSVIGRLDVNTATWDQTRYDPYGAIRDGNPVEDRGFLNQTNDPAQDLVYLNNRHYDPTTGVFVSVDPLVTMTMEPYIYGSANPVTISDPTGLCGCEDFTLANNATPWTDRSIANNEARHRWLTQSEPSSSTSSANASFRPISGAGSVQVNLFIPMEQIFWMGVGIEGDGRGFSSSAGLANSRATITLDLETGSGVAAFNYSCTSGGNCADAYSTSFLVNDVGAAVFGSGSANGVVLLEGGSGFSLIVTGKVSVGPPLAPSINGRLDFAIGSDGNATVNRSGNEFPAYEVYQTINGSREAVLTSPARTHGYLIDGPAGHIFRAVTTCDYNPLC